MKTNNKNLVKKVICILLIINCFANLAHSQFSLRIIVNTVATKKDDDIYVAGNFNNWNPKDANYRLKPYAAGRRAIVLKDLQAGNYAFKLTRGSWDKVECTNDGRDIEDRIIDVAADASISCDVAGWKDNYPAKPKPYTASPQVKIIDTAFVIPQLNRTRRVWIYLPKSYATSNKNYPVLYMQDGQNLFNERTANFGEWGVDETLDSLQKISVQYDMIVVGIDNGGEKRLGEYSPYDFEFNKTKIKAEGKLYADFLVHTLKPFIDSKYRTKKTCDGNFIAGSSMGAVISLYTFLQHPNIFCTVGIFSPAFWTCKDLFVDAALFKNNQTNIRLFFYAGGKEDNNMVVNLHKMADIFKNKVNIEIYRTISPIATHTEFYWRNEFIDFADWLLKPPVK